MGSSPIFLRPGGADREEPSDAEAHVELAEREEVPGTIQHVRR
jgi:hypothetical protein